MAINFPDSPSVDEIYSVGDKSWLWNGTYWEVQGAPSSTFSASDTAPADPDAGDIWYRSDTSQTLLFYDNTWVEIGHSANVPTYFADNDGDTKIQVEESADEDVIRFDAAGTEKAFIDGTGLTVSGDLDVTGTIAGGSTTFPTTLDSGTMPAIEALQAKVGADSSAVTSSLDYKVSTLETDVTALETDVTALETDVTALETGYRYHSTLYYTSNGTFSKASYPWLRAIRVTVQAGGGGGAHAETTSAGQCSVGGGGGSGTWAQSFITDIASLASSVTVSVGAKGNGGLYATSTAATAGGNSYFGFGAAYEVAANGGGAGITVTRTGASTGIGGAGASGGVGDLYIRGGGGSAGTVIDPANAYSGQGGQGAPSLLGNPGRTYRANQNSGSSEGYGAGGNGQARVQNLTGSDGRDGTAGIVIVELYA